MGKRVPSAAQYCVCYHKIYAKEGMRTSSRPEVDTCALGLHSIMVSLLIFDAYQELAVPA
jgi:hypothetical protein